MSNSYRYKKIDAFTAGASLGNPAACLYLSPQQRLGEDAMLEIAQQHKGFVSEVVYCVSDGADIQLTYFSSECEVDFCGHGTIACMYSLIQASPALMMQKEIPIRTNRKGGLTVFNRIAEQDAVLITAPQPLHIGTTLDGGSIAEKLGAPSEAVSTALPIDLIDAGLRTLIVPIHNLDTAISLYPNQQTLKNFCEVNGIDIILVFSMEVSQENHIAHTRVFAPRFGYLEDPATGSGNSAFGHYMLKNSLWDKTDCIIEQGGKDRVFNDIHLSYRDGAVLFGGGATVRIEGSYYL